MGMDINVHDQWACESMGTIQNRAKEHLGTTDKAISAYRRLLFQTIAKVEKGDLNIIGSGMKESGDSIKGPIALDAIGLTADCDTFWRDGDKKRRANCPWNANL
jgi:hypothetical protein